MKDRILTLSYKINTNPDASDYYTDYDEISADNGWEDYISRLENQYSDNSERSTEHTFQADYTTPIGKMHTVEGGMKYIIRNNSSENEPLHKACRRRRRICLRHGAKLSL